MALITPLSLKRIGMKTVKKVLILLPILTTLPSYSESFTAKRTGQGFTALTQDFTSSLSNPALLTKFDDDDDVFFSLNLGIMASDQYDVIDTAGDISDNLEQLANDINNITLQSFTSTEEIKNYSSGMEQQVDNIINDLEKIDEKLVNLRNGINFQILIPNSYLSFGLFTNQYGRIGGAVDYSEDDEQVLNDAIFAGELDLNDLESATLAVGYSVAEAGFIVAYPAIKQASYELSIGAKVKYQRIDLYYNRAKISDFNDDDFEITNDENTTDESSGNVDFTYI